MRVPGWSVAALLWVLMAEGVTGCASLREAIFPRPTHAPPSTGVRPAPAPAPVPAPPKEEAPPAAPQEKVPPPVLSPKAGAEDTERMKQASVTKIQQTEDIIKLIDQARLNKGQQDTYATVQSFLADARKALTAQDYLRASNLADKAHVLAEDLSRGLK